MNKICYGCGIKLQSNDSTKEGYIPIEKKDAGYCQRCFKLIHYGINNETNTPKSIDSLINNINKNNKMVLFLVDLLNISNEVINVFKKITAPKILIVNKCDIIPKSIKYQKISDFIKNEYSLNEEIKFISSYSNFGIKSLLDYLYNYNIKETYLMGESNSGKSTLLNKIIEMYNLNYYEITTSNSLNTTLDFIRIKLDEKLTIIDSPGFQTNRLFISNKKLKNNKIKPISFQMKENEILKIDNFYLKFKSNTNITLYLNNDLYIKKYYKELNFNDEINLSDNSDLIIKGLGFINIKNKTIISTNNIDKSLLETRNSIFRGNNE